MATREEVYSLFGIKSPAQIMAERREEAQRMLGKLDGAGQAGFGIGMGLQRLFGRKPEGLEQSEQFTQALAGVNPNDPAQLRELAKTVSGFAPEASLRILAQAQTLDTPETRNVYQKIKVPILNALTGQPTGQFEEKSIMRTAVYKQGKFIGYQDEQGNVVPASADSSIGVLDTPEAKASRAQTENGAVDLGDDVRLKLDGKTPVSDKQLEAARTGGAVIPDDGGEILPKDKFPVEQGTADIKRGITVTAEQVPASEQSDFVTTPLQRRDEAIGRLQQEDTSVLLRELKRLEGQAVLSAQDQELLRILTAELADRRKAPQQKQR